MTDTSSSPGPRPYQQHHYHQQQHQQQQQQWILALSFTALLLSLGILTALLVPVVSRYVKAYLDAPSEVAAFLDAVDSSVAENESYDCDVARLRRLEDRLRLDRLLREIQRAGDALREELNALVVAAPPPSSPRSNGAGGGLGGGEPRLQNWARFWWASHRERLQEKVRRMDMLRMRFLVAHMSIIAAGGAAVPAASAATITAGETASRGDRNSLPLRDPEKYPLTSGLPLTPLHNAAAGGPALPKGLADGIRSKPPLRKLTVNTGAGPAFPGEIDGNQRKGWAGVVMELQKSPILRERHASIEMAMARHR